MSKGLNLGSILTLKALTSDPVSAANGTLYYNTTSGTVRIYQNSSWGTVATGSVSLTGQSLIEYGVIIGSATNQSTAVNTNTTGHIFANSTLGLRIKSDVITDAMINSSAAISRSKIASGTANKVVINSGTGALSESAVTSTELSQLTGVSSNIQTQLDTKASETYVDDAIAAIPAADLTPYLKKDGTVRISGNLAPVTSSIVRLGRSFDNSEIQPFYEAFIETVYYGQDGARGHIDGNGGNFRIINDTNNSDISLHVQGTGSVNVNNAKIKGVVDPTDAQEAATKNYVDTQVANYLPLSGGSMMGNIHMSGEKITGLGAPTASLDAARKIDIENALSGLDFQKDVDDIQFDNTLVPVATLGKRYIITDALNLHAGFGTIVGVEYGDIVEYNGSAFEVAYDVSVQGSGALVWSKQYTLFFRWNGTSWSEFGGLSSLNAGIGLIKTGNVIDVNLGAGIAQLPSDEVGIDLYSSSGLMLTVDGSSESSDTAAQLSIKLDGSSLSKTVSGLRVAAGGINESHIASNAGIQFTKLQTLGVNKAVQTDASGVIVESAVTSAELGYLSGVTGAIQTQIDGRANTALSNLASTAVNVGLKPVQNTDLNSYKPLGDVGYGWGRAHANVYRPANSTQALTITTTSASTTVTVPAGTNGLVANATYIYHATAFPNGANITAVSGTGPYTLTVDIAASATVTSDTAAQLLFGYHARSEDETTNNSGPANLRSGNTTSGKTGEVYIRSGRATSGGTTGNITLTTGTTSGTRGNVIVGAPSFIPFADNSISVGTSSTSFANVYAYNTHAVTSSLMDATKTEYGYVKANSTNNSLEITSIASKRIEINSAADMSITTTTGLVEVNSEAILLNNSAAIANDTFTLNSSVSSYTATGIAFNKNTESVSKHIFYEVKDSTTGHVRAGYMTLAISGSVAAISDVFSATGGSLDTNIDFDATVDGSGDVNVVYINNGSNSCSFKVIGLFNIV